MKTIQTIIAGLMAALLLLALPAQAQRIDVGLQSAIVYQSLEHSIDDNSFGELAPGFQNAVGNLTFGAQVYEGAEVNLDIFISSKHHLEAWGYQGYFQMNRLPDWMKLGALGTFFDDHLQIKAGQMTLDFGDGFLYRSINGDVYNNELVGNPVATAALTTLGMEAAFTGGPFGAMAGFSNGTTKGDLQPGKGLALHGKVWVEPSQSTRLAASVYRVDHSGNGTGYPGTGTKSYLFSQGDRGGSRYDIWAGPDGGQIFFGKEQDVTVFQFDGRLDLKPFLIYGAAGFYRDRDCNGTVDGLDNGNPEDRWAHYMVTARYNLTEWFYLAGRFSTAAATRVYLNGTEDVNTDGHVDRIQVGGGFRLYNGILLKVEYVKQTTDGFPQGYFNNRVNLGLNPSFSGISVETAVSL